MWVCFSSAHAEASPTLFFLCCQAESDLNPTRLVLPLSSSSVFTDCFSCINSSQTNIQSVLRPLSFSAAVQNESAERGEYFTEELFSHLSVRLTRPVVLRHFLTLDSDLALTSSVQRVNICSHFPHLMLSQAVFKHFILFVSVSSLCCSLISVLLEVCF